MEFKEIEKKSQTLFFIALIIAMLSFVLRTTTWQIPDIVHSIMQKGIALPLIFLRFLIILQSYSKKLVLLFLLTFPVILLIKINTGNYTYILYPFLFTVSAKNIDFTKIIKTIFYTTLLIIIISIIASKLGYIENRIFYRNDGTIRQSLGVIYPTDFAAHIFYILLSYFYIKKGKIKIYDYVIVTLILGVLIKYCNARLDSISILLFFISLLFIKYKRISKIKKIYKFIIISSIPTIALITYLLTINYDSKNLFYIILNVILSGRLQLGYNALTEYGIKLFGQYYIQYGANSGSYYNFIDSSYIVLLIIYGLYYFILVMLTYVYICKRCCEQKDSLMISIVLIIGINSMISQHFMEFAYNPFYLYLFAKTNPINCYKLTKNEK